ncbi:Protein hcp1 [Rubrivivax sp. A210]|uniref:Hcp family type VI secretion system effector n=1 Tax=Rubrivivax sp. A210 TaxID=2772301 RepID=UPI00191A4F59|nr:type VI secretion system tube protein Hcp [Rubrivivax sp. A210]CAD5369322.1 Protein hcp1 [Rubrivivax sp. A210]
MPGNFQDFTLKIDGIKGESRGASTKDEIDLESWTFGITQSGSFGSGGGGGVGKVQFQDISFRARISCASPKLMDACASGKHIERAVLTCRKAGGRQEVFYTMTLSDVLVSAYDTGYSGVRSGELQMPIDQFSLNFARIETAYGQQDSKGGVGAAIKSGWDLRKNVKI